MLYMSYAVSAMVKIEINGEYQMLNPERYKIESLYFMKARKDGRSTMRTHDPASIYILRENCLVQRYRDTYRDRLAAKS